MGINRIVFLSIPLSLLLYGSKSYSVPINTFILQCSINYIMNAGRLHGPLISNQHLLIPLQYSYVFLLNIFVFFLMYLRLNV